MNMSKYFCAAAIAFCAVAPPAAAATVYSSEASFVAAAGTAKATLPSFLAPAGSFNTAPFAFSSDAGQTFVIDTSVYGQAISGEDNLLISGYESQTLVSSIPLYAFGLQIFQPSNAAPVSGPNGVACYTTCDSGSFTIALFQGAAIVDSFTFTPVNNTVEFHGYAGSTPFTRIRINDDLGTIDNEYFATYRYATQPVPELSTSALLVVGLALILIANKRRGAFVRVVPTAA